MTHGRGAKHRPAAENMMADDPVYSFEFWKRDAIAKSSAWHATMRATECPEPPPMLQQQQKIASC